MQLYRRWVYRNTLRLLKAASLACKQSDATLRIADIEQPLTSNDEVFTSSSILSFSMHAFDPLSDDKNCFYILLFYTDLNIRANHTFQINGTRCGSIKYCRRL